MSVTTSWKTEPLREVVTFDRAVVSPQQAGARQYVGLEDVQPDGSLYWKEDQRLPVSDKFAFDRGHILYGKLRPYLRKVARPAFDGMCSTDILPLRPKRNVSRDYLYHFLRTEEFAQQATARSAGVNLPRISPSVLAEFPVALPTTLFEQCRIAAILDKADAIRARRRAALADADKFIASAFAHLVGELAPGHEQWPLRTIEQIAKDRPGSMRTGPFGSDLRHSEFTDEGITVLGIDNAVQNRFAWGERRFITAEKYQKLQRYRVLPGDVIVTIMGTTGRSAVVPDNIPVAISTKHLATISLDREQADPYFISWAIHSAPALRRQIAAANKGAIMDGLNLTIIRGLKIRRPPLPLQQRFAEAVRRHYALVEQAGDPVLNGDALYASLAARAFRGEL